MKKVILFDFDGTIADSFESFFGIINKLSKKYHFRSVRREDLNQLRTKSALDLLKEFNISWYKIPFIARDFKHLQQEEIDRLKPIKGIAPVLQRLKNTYTLGIVTSNSRKNVEAFLKKNNCDVFTYVYTDSSFFGKDKMINGFLKKYSFAKEDVLYVGDEIRDIQACKKAGIAVIAVSWGFNVKKGLAKYNPAYLIDSPKDLLTVL